MQEGEALTCCLSEGISCPRTRRSLQLVHSRFSIMHLEVSNRLGVEFPQLLRCSSKFRRRRTPRAVHIVLRNFSRPTQLIFMNPWGLIPCSNAATNRFGAPDYRAIFRTQSDSASAQSTPLSDPCPPGSLIFSKNLSNEMIRPKHLPETVMRARLECKRSSDPTFNHSVR